MREAEQLVQRIIREARDKCGDDPLAIARYVEARVAEMSPEDRRLFEGVAEAASNYDAPEQGGFRKTH